MGITKRVSNIVVWTAWSTLFPVTVVVVGGG
jgi:hypothetical protein